MATNKNDDINTVIADENTDFSGVSNTFDLYTSEKFIDPNAKVLSKNNDSKRESTENFNDLKPDLQYKILTIQNQVSKDKIDKLLNRDKSEDLKNLKSDDPKITESEQKAIMKNLNKWESTKEINVANASVVASWLDKFSKLK